MKKRSVAVFLVTAALQGCGWAQHQSDINDSIDHYHASKSSIRLGMNLSEFTALLAPYEDKLTGDERRNPDRFTSEGAIYDVFYVLSERIADGEWTDDEYTPHVFKDGKLSAIGWKAIGGEKRTSQDVANERAARDAAEDASDEAARVACINSGGTPMGTMCLPKNNEPLVPTEPLIQPSQPSTRTTCTTVGNTTTCQ